ncbi:MAG: hypothetical protein HOP14_04735, partial [Acidobacteria bacterium]|nr:hypothetical protein [Acidobacteriota bacterium]
MPTRTRLDVPTPALLVDRAALDRNIARMAAFFATGACRLRPHFKAHKTPEIARRQLAAGSCTGLTCATVGEAEVAAAVCTDILVASGTTAAGAPRTLQGGGTTPDGGVDGLDTFNILDGFN